jgi:hypothetical protein
MTIETSVNTIRNEDMVQCASVGRRASHTGNTGRGLCIYIPNFFAIEIEEKFPRAKREKSLQSIVAVYILGVMNRARVFS